MKKQRVTRRFPNELGYVATWRRARALRSSLVARSFSFRVVAWSTNKVTFSSSSRADFALIEPPSSAALQRTRTLLFSSTSPKPPIKAIEDQLVFALIFITPISRVVKRRAWSFKIPICPVLVGIISSLAFPFRTILSGVIPRTIRLLIFFKLNYYVASQLFK